MRQIATGHDGTGYEINYAVQTVPEDIDALKLAAIAEQDPEAKKRKIETYQQAVRDWSTSPAALGAFLIVDGWPVKSCTNGVEARGLAQAMEPSTSVPDALAATFGARTLPAAPLRWRTE